jgi:hypothetical protein
LNPARYDRRKVKKSGGGVGMLTFGIVGAAFGLLFFGSLFSGDPEHASRHSGR